MTKSEETKEPVVEQTDEQQTKDDIADLLGIPSEEGKKVEPNKPEVKGTPFKVEPEDEEEPEVEEEPEELEGETEEEEPAEEEHEEEGEEEPEDEDFALKEIARLGELLSGKKEEKTEVVETEEEEKPKEIEEPKKVEEPKFDVQNFASEDDLSDFEPNEVKAINKVLSKVYTAAIKDARRMTFQETMNVIPKMIELSVQGHIAAQEFWTNNPGLKKVTEKYPGLKQYVAFRADELQNVNKTWTLGQVYSQLTKEIKDVLGDRLKEKADEETPSNGGTKPAFAQRPGSARKGVRTKSKDGGLTAQQKEIAELMSLSR